MERKRLRFPRTRRLTRSQDLALVRTTGRRIRGRLVELRTRVGGGDQGLRIGIIVPRHSHSAADRNRIKRRIREIVRVDWLGTDEWKACVAVVFTLPAAYSATFVELRSELRLLRERAAT